jgi:flagellar protein FliS
MIFRRWIGEKPNSPAARADSQTVMATETPNPYLKTKVMTASPAQLRLMLLDGAIKFLQQGKAGLAAKDYEASYNGFSRCQDIVMELISGLRPEQSRELCDKLSGLYTYMYTQLVRACVERDAEIAEEVLGLLRYERETWVMLMDQLEQENAAGAADAADIAQLAAEAGSAPPNGTGANADDLVGGRISVEG